MTDIGSIASRLKRHKTLTYGLSNALVVASGVLLQLAGNADGWVRAVGQSSIAAGVVGLILLFYTWLDLSERASEAMLSTAGVTGAYADRDDDGSRNYAVLVKQARRHVDILGYGLSTFRQGQIVGGQPWPTQAKVRVLLVDPVFPDTDTPYADQRDIEEEVRAYHQTRIDVEEFVRTCATHQQNASDVADKTKKESLFEMRLFGCLPSVTIFRVDHVLYWGPYLVGVANRQCPLVRVEAGGFLYDQLLDHFDRVWAERSWPAPDDWLA